jgi:hypothetical protein
MGKGPADARFWSKVNKTADCWLWTASTNSTGYGSFSPAVGERVLAHRWSYEQLVGPIPAGLVIDHLCRTPRCVKPAHLEPVTQRENVRRGAAAGLLNGTRTTCIHGHEYTEANTYHSPNRPGHKQCRSCISDRLSRRTAAARATFTEVPEWT